ncbi:hypothetical protein [Streptomyces sp. NPDC059708]|uniref:hypothetical protein n=1 Tax=Streptomyces sp. NPDC059708 TaxID=3346916 RepID=UPI0036C39063
MTLNTCPRCTGPLGIRPALSRITTARTLTICTPCGIDEALRDADRKAPIPPTEWPITS